MATRRTLLPLLLLSRAPTVSRHSIACKYAATPSTDIRFASTMTSPFKWDPKANPYPQARREEHYDTYKSEKHGEVKVHDPYRWLEIPPSESAETKKFVQEQADLTERYLSNDPNRDSFAADLKENWNYARCASAEVPTDYVSPANRDITHFMELPIQSAAPV